MSKKVYAKDCKCCKFIELRGNAKNLTNKRFGKLIAIGAVKRDNNGRLMWLCKCDCGNEAIIKSDYLIQGSKKSCGCLWHPKGKDHPSYKYGRKTADSIYRNKNLEKRNAKAKVEYALKTGKLTKPELCEACKEKRKLEGHHFDYSKPLEVVWLCHKCHSAVRSGELRLAQAYMCCECKKNRAVAWFPVCDPDIPSNPYCRKCLDEAKERLTMEILKMGEM